MFIESVNWMLKGYIVYKKLTFCFGILKLSHLDGVFHKRRKTPTRNAKVQAKQIIDHGRFNSNVNTLCWL
jgi:hypothetical protein